MDLEKLSDQELRTRLSQFGFPNLPVTDTTRKVLVKKLKNAIEGQAAKTKRNTVAVTKFSSDEEPEEKVVRKTSTRRATVAVPEKVSNGTSNSRAETPTKPPSRRSVARQTPVKDKEPILVLEDSDEDIIETRMTRRSRTNTPTLGKSQTIRTSYETTKVVAEEPESSEQDDPLDPEPVFAQTTTRRKTFTTSTARVVPEKPATPTQFGRRTLTTSYNPNPKSSSYVSEPVEIREGDTPYLSNFAKRLSTLRAEPIDPGMEKYKSWKDSAGTSSYSYPTTSQPRKQGGVMHGLGKTFDAADKKYNFRNTLYVIAIIMIIIAIYVIFM